VIVSEVSGATGVRAAGGGKIQNLINGYDLAGNITSITDQLGTPQKITNALGVIIWDGVFDPFGKPAIRRRRRHLGQLHLGQLRLGRRVVADQSALPRPIRRRRDRPQPKLVPRLRPDDRAVHPERHDRITRRY
jgi:hypothetical protein